jgi:hypothetical protein
MEWQQIFIKGEQTLSIYDDRQETPKNKHSVSESAKFDARLIAIVKLLARIAAERDYNSFIHQYEETNHD